MIDTVRVRSGYMSEQEAALCEEQLDTLFKVDNSTGEELFTFVSGELAGSYDHRVMARVERKEWTTAPGPSGHQAVRRPTAKKGRELPHKVDSPPYLVLEGSVHKHMLGHNVYGGPRDPAAAAAWFIGECLRRLDLWTLDEWEFELLRLDWASVFRPGPLPSLFLVRSLSRARFPRRLLDVHQDESLSVGGTTTRLNVYRKGPEFEAHDMKRLRGHVGEEQLGELLARAHATLRVETQFTSKGIEALYGERPKVWQLNDWTFEDAHWREVERLAREGAGVMETVREREAVMARLYAVYTKRQARLLFGTWAMLAGREEADVKAEMSPRSFYRHRKMLVDAGVTWHGAELGSSRQSLDIPDDFKLSRDSPYLDRSEAREVAQAYVSYREQHEDMELV